MNCILTTTEIKISKKLENGIFFSCEMCGACCRGFQEGEVYLYKEDIIRLARFLKYHGKSGLKKFAGKHIKIIDEKFYWKEPGAKRGRNYSFKTLGFKFTGDDEHCYFLDINNRCTVHEARPFQCRCFPWWQIMVSNRKNFLNYSKKCLGLRALKGKFYSREEILKWAIKEYEIEKEFFLEMKKNDFNIFKVYKFLPKNITC